MRILQLFCVLAIAATSAAAQSASETEFFEKSVRPLLAENCQACHNAQMATSGLDLSSGEGFMKGGASGPLVSRDSPADSLLLNVIGYSGSLKMPPSGKLGEEQRAILSEWVGKGAPWPGVQAVQPAVAGEKNTFTAEQQAYWAFQPVADPEPPQVQDEAWVRNEVDRFILAKLEAEGTKPSSAADRATLLRRASFDLTGLPPTTAELEAFLADDRPAAFERVVDRLLASPRYGERWGRRWLDVARYADSTGNDEDHRYPYAWRYRDYVIDAFNSDLPYDQFVREQIAGDLMPAEDGSEINRRGIVATGLIALGPKAIAQQDKTKMLYDVYDEQVDVVSKAILGMTIACARCHDHKFDAILTRDYYSMINFFANTKSFTDPSTHVSKLLFVPLAPAEQWNAYQSEQDEMRRRKAELAAGPQIDVEEYVGRFAGSVSSYLAATQQGTSAATELEAEMVARWSNFVMSDNADRAYLDAWRTARPEDRSVEAEKLAAAFNSSFDDWRKQTHKYREASAQPLEAITMGAPTAPKVQRGEDPLFYDLYFAEDGPFSYITDEARAPILRPSTVERNAQLETELAALDASAMAEPDRACAVTDGGADGPVDQHVFIRGDYNSEGEPAPKAFMAILEGVEQPPVQTNGSGRLELAEWMTQPDHPLTTRVMVNRIWQGHFGEGIVRTPNNFGRMGDRPSHPELLDYLSRRFVEDGWSIKSLHKRIMLSSAYQMSSETSAAEAEYDPENRLISRFSRRRLEVEEIRDGLLKIGGALDETMGGTLQAGFGTDGENSNSRLSLNPDDLTRRTVYIPLRRANVSTLFNIFDFGDATTSQGRRAVTNVAPQALFMMNSEFVARQARQLAEQAVRESSGADERVRLAYMSALNRQPTAADQDFAMTYLASVRERFSDMDELDAWQSFCRILLSSNEFIYVN
jgi:hypothetical protein